MEKGVGFLRKFIFSISIICLIAALGYIFYDLVFLSLKNGAVTNDIQKIAYDIPEEDKENSSDNDSPSSPKYNWKKLKDINPEIVAWVKIPHTNIDYPVLQHKEDNENDQYYLYRDYNKDYSQYGSVFIDYRSDMNSKNIILHGHHMIDGSMFSDLVKYGGADPDIGFYKGSPYIYFSTPEEDCVYEIISVLKTPQDNSNNDFFNYMVGNFSTNRDFLNYLYSIRIRSMINCPVSSNENDQLLTLSTCSYEYSGTIRTVVVARKLRNDEPLSYVGGATENKNVLHGVGYYEKYGGTRPKELTFEEDFKNLYWYDGNVNPQKSATP